jgi:hypothetical protein
MHGSPSAQDSPSAAWGSHSPLWRLHPWPSTQIGHRVDDHLRSILGDRVPDMLPDDQPARGELRREPLLVGPPHVPKVAAENVLPVREAGENDHGDVRHRRRGGELVPRAWDPAELGALGCTEHSPSTRRHPPRAHGRRQTRLHGRVGETLVPALDEDESKDLAGIRASEQLDVPRAQRVTHQDVRRCEPLRRQHPSQIPDRIAARPYTCARIVLRTPTRTLPQRAAGIPGTLVGDHRGQRGQAIERHAPFSRRRSTEPAFEHDDAPTTSIRSVCDVTVVHARPTAQP